MIWNLVSCPECGHRKHQLVTCSNCGYQPRKTDHPAPQLNTALQQPDKRKAKKPRKLLKLAKAKVSLVKCPVCDQKVKQSNLSKHLCRVHPSDQPVSQRSVFASNARIRRQATKDQAREMRRAYEDNALCGDEQIARFLQRNPAPEPIGKFGVPQDKYRWGFYGSKSMEYDGWRLEYREKD